jgi:hypothetical protein
MKTNTLEAPYEMANLFPKHTGLPFVVWISMRGNVGYDEGVTDASALAQLKAWIDLNRATLVSYWEGDIDTQDALEALVKIAAEVR